MPDSLEGARDEGHRGGGDEEGGPSQGAGVWSMAGGHCQTLPLQGMVQAHARTHASKHTHKPNKQTNKQTNKQKIARARAHTHTQELVDNRTGCFEWFGLDFMVDRDLHVWNLECNISPDLSRGTEVCPSPRVGGRAGEDAFLHTLDAACCGRHSRVGGRVKLVTGALARTDRPGLDRMGLARAWA